MTEPTRFTTWAATLAVTLSVSMLIPGAPRIGAAALAQGAPQTRPHTQAHSKKPAPPEAAAPAAQAPKLPPRIPFTAADDAVATIPGMPDVRFFADSIADFNKALPSQPGPWLVLSTGGSDGAFGAGFLNGLSAAGNRPDYTVVTGVLSGALMAPFVFAGSRYDGALTDAYTKTTAADIFEVGGTGESFLDTWPLKDLIAKEITPQLIADIAAAHQAGRRLFVVTTDLDAERSVVWNMGALAVHAQKGGGDAALKLFRQVLLASGAIPGAFPPVLIDVEGNGKKFQEMHVDGGVGGQFFVAPPSAMESNSGYKIPATQLYIVVNSSLTPDFDVVERSTPLDPRAERRRRRQGRPAADARPRFCGGAELRCRLQRRHHSGKLQCPEPRRLRSEIHESVIRCRLRSGQRRECLRTRTAGFSGRARGVAGRSCSGAEIERRG